MEKCENCDCLLTEYNCSYEDGICDDCFEDREIEDELSEIEDE